MTEASHSRFDGQASLYSVDALSAVERDEFEAHLAGCDLCRQEVEALRPVIDGLATAVPLREPPPGLRDRVLTTAAGAPPRLESVVADGEGRRRVSRLALAASLLAVAGLGWYIADQRREIRSLQAALDTATERLETVQGEAASARGEASQATARLAVLAAPDLVEFPLVGQPVAPEAVGRVLWSASQGLVISAADVPALPAGSVYQLWFVTSPDPISAGLLRPDPSGRIVASVVPPPPIEEPTTMALTIEPDGGVPAPTGDMYLVGGPAN